VTEKLPKKITQSDPGNAAGRRRRTLFAPNEGKVLAQIGPNDVVLDVGGCARAFNRANYVIDFLPYELRGRYYHRAFGLGPQGGPVECFTAETYIRRDLCDRTPWPFGDKSIDYCVCSHTLEDLRDPLWVCQEMVRIAKRGYIETPSRAFEASRNREPGVPVGLSHHRWHVEIEGPHITFYPKSHDIHGHTSLSLPESYWKTLPEEQMVTWLFWEGDFTCSEGWLTKTDLEAFVKRHTDGAEEATEADRLRLLLLETRQELEALRTPFRSRLLSWTRRPFRMRGSGAEPGSAPRRLMSAVKRLVRRSA
jgi:hypothetical protein